MLESSIGCTGTASIKEIGDHFGLESFFHAIEQDGPHTIRIICEPTSMMWFPLSVAAKKRGHWSTG
ncbi:hypothetical protein ACFO1S_23610 [Cohnella boryungensis]|uniref:Uncharacterized protein n=1 Tax=Cohnella boryungensis TaxID=768479 RepID=A0ABV8SFT1_9BACL